MNTLSAYINGTGRGKNQSKIIEGTMDTGVGTLRKR